MRKCVIFNWIAKIHSIVAIFATVNVHLKKKNVVWPEFSDSVCVPVCACWYERGKNAITKQCDIIHISNNLFFNLFCPCLKFDSLNLFKRKYEMFGKQHNNNELKIWSIIWHDRLFIHPEGVMKTKIRHKHFL